MAPQIPMIDWKSTTVMDMMKIPPAGSWWEDANFKDAPESKHGWFVDAMAHHDTCIVGAWNMLTRVKVTGPDAETFFQGLITNSWNNFYPGRVKHALFCNDDGKLVINGLLIYLAEHEFIFTGGPRALWVAYQAEITDLDVQWEIVEEISWSISGKTAVYACEEACGESLRDIKFMHFREVEVDGIKCRCIRQSMTAELGYEFQAPIEYFEPLKNACIKAAEKFGGVAYGSLGGMTQEVESGFLQEMCDFMPAIATQSEDDIAYREFEQKHMPGIWHMMIKKRGSFEYDDPTAMYRSPIEIGEGAMVKFDHDFKGRAALEAEHANPPHCARALIYNPEDILDLYRSYFDPGQEPYRLIDFPHITPGYLYCDKVLDREGREVGSVTRPCYSPHYRTYFASAMLDVAVGELGTELFVVTGEAGSRQKWIRATVAPLRIKEDHRRDDVSALPSYLGVSDDELPEFPVKRY